MSCAVPCGDLAFSSMRYSPGRERRERQLELERSGRTGLRGSSAIYVPPRFSRRAVTVGVTPPGA